MRQMLSRYQGKGRAFNTIFLQSRYSKKILPMRFSTGKPRQVTPGDMRRIVTLCDSLAAC